MSERKNSKKITQALDNICALFQNQAKITPYHTAVIYKNLSLTYNELDTYSTAIAMSLKARGVQQETVVALGLYNSLELIVGMLAIFKSGGVYLPIDPNYPCKRIKAMLDDAKPKFLLTSNSVKHLFLDSKIDLLEFEKLKKEQHNLSLNMPKPHELAYIIFTSGTTGNPKGIMVEHGALCHAVNAYCTLHPEILIALMLGSISFDPSLLIVSHSLTSGGTVCLIDNKTGINPDNFYEIIDVINTKNVNLILTTPSFYSELIKRSNTLPPLKGVDLCGEPIPKGLPAMHKQKCPEASLINAYGPSEYAMGSTAKMLYNPKTKNINKITIGKPFSQNLAYILDENGQPTKAGKLGELFVGGSGLARGYLNQQQLTKEKFLNISINGKPPVRLYKTGDSARRTKSGEIEFLGRKDLQVKLHGHRVELKEIENHIYKFPAIKEIVLATEEAEHNQTNLIAFFTTTDSRVATEEQLKAFLSDRLPFFMVPSQFIEVKNWPYTQNGKIDQKALLSKIEKHAGRNVISSTN